LTFGLCATPAKPFSRPHDWLTLRPVHAPNAKLFLHGWGGGTRWQGFPIAGQPHAPDPQKFDDSEFVTRVSDWQSQGGLSVVYLTPGVMVLDIPEVKSRYTQWQSQPEIRGTLDTRQVMVIACTRSKGWPDLFLWRLKEFVEKYPIDGIYMDWGFAQRCHNASHGCGYITGSERKGTWPIFALRQVNKRIYKVMKQANPDALVVGHANGALCLPHVNFWSAYIDGEYINAEMRRPPYNGDYTAFYSPARATIEFSGRPFGSVPLFMAYTEKGGAGATDTVLAYALINGSIVWPAWVDLDVLFPVYEALDRFGVADVGEFVPYWNNQNLVQTSSADLRVTAYKKQRSALLAISNLTPADITDRITIDPARLGLREDRLTAEDAMSGKRIHLQDSSFELRVKKNNYRLVVLHERAPDASD
jgi:hypothetical protein